jgi:hypothetical protein
MAPVRMLKSLSYTPIFTNGMRLKEKATHGILTVAIWSPDALVRGQLHEPLFAGSTDGAGIARAFLHGKGRQHNRRDFSPARTRSACTKKRRWRVLTVKLAAILLEERNKVAAGREGSAWLVYGLLEIHYYELIDGYVGGSPATVVYATGQPPFSTVGSGGGSDVG